jgi:hypothetical protein
LFSFFFFGVNRVEKDGAIVARNGKDEDNVDGVEHNVAVLTNDNNRVNSNNIGGDNDANNGADNNDNKNTDNNNNNAVFTPLNSADLPFVLTCFVGVTIERGDSHFVKVFPFGGVWFFVFFAMVG